MSCLGIGGVGCLVIILAFLAAGGFVAYKYGPQWKAALEEFEKDAASNPEKAAAKLIVKVIPDAQLVREDDAAKTVTFKVGEAGEELTMHYEGISQKKTPKFTNSKGEIVNESGAVIAPAPATDSAAPPATPAPQN